MRSTRVASPVAGRVFFYGTTTIALGIGALQMFHVRGGFITDYGADLFGTAWFYAMSRQGRTVFQRKHVAHPGTTAAFVFIGCAGPEFAQKFHLFPGVFDPFDFLAYAVGVLACYGFDRLVRPLA